VTEASRAMKAILKKRSEKRHQAKYVDHRSYLSFEEEANPAA
jgi:hypothetical protein